MIRFATSTTQKYISYIAVFLLVLQPFFIAIAQNPEDEILELFDGLLDQASTNQIMQENQINQTSNTDEISQENSQEDNQESNDDNNNATSNTSNTNNQPLPDINISSAQYTKENHSITVGICQSQANYNNEIHTTLSLSYGEDQWNKQMPVVVPQGAGCTQTTIPLDPTSQNIAGTTIVEIIVDNNDTIQETSEQNNHYILATTFNTTDTTSQQSSLPDFSISNSTYDTLTRRVNVQFCQTNEQHKEKHSVLVGITIDNTRFYGDKEIILEGKKCYTTSRERNNIGLLTSGDYTIEASIDYNQQLPESNEDNNKKTTTLRIQLEEDEEFTQQFVTQYPSLVMHCNYTQDYLITSCGKYEDVRKRMNGLLSQMDQRITQGNISGAMLSEEIAGMQNLMVGLANNFAYELNEEETNRKDFIFAYTNYSLQMYSYYHIHNKISNFINDMLQ